MTPTRNNVASDTYQNLPIYSHVTAYHKSHETKEGEESEEEEEKNNDDSQLPINLDNTLHKQPETYEIEVNFKF
jgi:hypothetical protein